MKIAVCVKQVPDTSNVEIDPETHTLRREGVESILNPLDTFAVEQSLRIREECGGEVTVFTMGPPQAEEMLREVMSLGADHTILICGKHFAGSDTWATSLALASALEHSGPWDIILCGKQAVDGDTAQVGPEIAAHLNIPEITFVSKIREIKAGDAVVERMTETGTEVLRSPLPVLMTVLKDLNEPRVPNLKDLCRARFAPVRVLDSADLNLKAGQTGLSGSPTRVRDMFSPASERNVRLFKDDCMEGFKQLLKHIEILIKTDL